MSATALDAIPVTLESVHHQIIEQLATRGWSLTPDYMGPQDTQALALEAERYYLDQEMFRAGVGRNLGYRVDRAVRSDYVRWLDPHCADGVLGGYFERLAALKAALNLDLFMGLFDLECHMAIYPPGARYARHLDAFQGGSLRTLSCILYLNADWSAGDGGQLRIYTQPEEETQFVEIPPLGGQLVTFLSDRFSHEVLPTRRRRISISGWFRRRPSQPL
jgi:SM-20-related protein